MDRADPPAVMFEDSLERRLAVDVADQADGRGVEVGGDLDLLFLGCADDRLDGQVIVQRLAAAAVDVADRRADLGVGVGVDVFLRGSRSVGRRAAGPPGSAGRVPKVPGRTSGSTLAANSGSVRIRQNVLSASQKRFNGQTSRSSANRWDQGIRSRAEPVIAGPVREPCEASMVGCHSLTSADS